MNQLDPALLIGLGALLMLTVILLVGFGVAIAVGSAVWRRFVVFDDMSAKREDGKVRLSGNLQDLARPARAKRAKGRVSKSNRYEIKEQLTS